MRAWTRVERESRAEATRLVRSRAFAKDGRRASVDVCGFDKCDVNCFFGCAQTVLTERLVSRAREIVILLKRGVRQRVRPFQFVGRERGDARIDDVVRRGREFPVWTDIGAGGAECEIAAGSHRALGSIETERQFFNGKLARDAEIAH